jgi:hypothetical protein
MAKFLFAFWRLCEQRIAVTKAAAIPHSARVLADKAGVTPRRAGHPAPPSRRAGRGRPGRRQGLAAPVGRPDA